MKRFMVFLILFLSLIFMTSPLFADVNPYVLGSSEVSTGDPCSCPASEYDFCWTGEVQGSATTACTDSGNNTIVGVTTGTPVFSALYANTGDVGAQVNADPEALYFNYSGIEGTVGTICWDIYPFTPGNTNGLLRSTITDDVDEIYCTHQSTNTLYCAQEGQNQKVSITHSATIPVSYTRVCFSWSAAENKIALKVNGVWETACNAGPPTCTYDENQDVTDFTGGANPTTFYLWREAGGNELRFDNFVYKQAWQADI